MLLVRILLICWPLCWSLSIISMLGTVALAIVDVNMFSCEYIDRALGSCPVTAISNKIISLDLMKNSSSEIFLQALYASFSAALLSAANPAHFFR